MTPASEGRTAGDVAKGAESTVQRLEKSFEEATDPVIKMQVGEALTLERLREAHTSGAI